MEGRYNIIADKDIPPADNGVGVERHRHDVLMPSSSAKDHLEGTTPPLVWNASCVSCSKSKKKCDGLRPCRSVCTSHRFIALRKKCMVLLLCRRGTRTTPYIILTILGILCALRIFGL